MRRVVDVLVGEIPVGAKLGDGHVEVLVVELGGVGEVHVQLVPGLAGEGLHVLAEADANVGVAEAGVAEHLGEEDEAEDLFVVRSVAASEGEALGPHDATLIGSVGGVDHCSCTRHDAVIGRVFCCC